MRSVTVVGASLAGSSTIRALREQGFDGRITAIGAETHLPYDRPPLSKEFLAGSMSADELSLLSGEDEQSLRVDWLLGRTATALDPSTMAVVLDDGQRIVSDAVVLATGARARQLPGPRPAGVHTVRTLEDATALRAELRPGARVVLIGGGFIGAEIASTAAQLGAGVTIVEAVATPLAVQLGDEVASACTALHADNGVTLLTGVGVAELVSHEDGALDAVRAVRLTDGRELPADVVVVGIGAIPNTEWLAGSGLAVDGGIITDAGCATDIPGIVAVGDCASSYRHFTGATLRLEHWTNAVKQPAAAAATLLGLPAPKPDVPYFWSDQHGSRLQFAGHRTAGAEVEITEGSAEERSFLAVYRSAGEPVAVFALNRPKPFNRLRRELATRATAHA
ncbi:NAD(P)/FAD-dependent oxidoreductase [Pseudonocardia spinosispora]|uniref:NAD(P)/FAD-dependent oxidoreductase n=1 Tax=Pseudonocardia spinosispora TaxID=103441 RepID=UPI0004005C8F|nr:FAD-dependent oxidoreductase [Pseudonocardia spinosispora]